MNLIINNLIEGVQSVPFLACCGFWLVRFQPQALAYIYMLLLCTLKN
uniref:Uncharacterized protein n=1 Tax=virus sp. ctCsQ3 TaxID=2826794 RepID=A0A8S5R6U1_9VIRU|nr:MAG TPA: hypothetical protein [virus sp. ctCsQ3]